MRSERSANSLDMGTQFLKAKGRANFQSVLDFQFAHSGSVLLRIEIGAVEYPDKHVAIDYVAIAG